MCCAGSRYDTSELQKMVDEKKRTEADSQASMLWVDGIERFISMRKQAERKVRAGSDGHWTARLCVTSLLPFLVSCTAWQSGLR